MPSLKLKEYYMFVRWCSIPDWVKQELEWPVTQKDFGKLINVSETMLSLWKTEENFEEDVNREMQRWAKSLTPNVVSGLYRKATTGVGGDAAAVKLWMQLFENFREEGPTGRQLPPNGAAAKITGESFLDEDGNILYSTKTLELIKKRMNGDNKEQSQHTSVLL